MLLFGLYYLDEWWSEAEDLILLCLLHRPYWRCYYSNTDAVIYVVDSSDRDRMGISKSELVAMLEVSFMVSVILHLIEHIIQDVDVDVEK